MAAQPKIIDLAEYRSARQPARQPDHVPAAAPALVWVPVWVALPAWRPF